MILSHPVQISTPSVQQTYFYGQNTSDQKVADFGPYAEVSLWYDHLTAQTYFVDNTDKSYPITMAYYDGTMRPTTGSDLEIEPKTRLYLDTQQATSNNQQLAVSNVSITLSSNDVVEFDYNNTCIYNSDTEQNTIRLSIDEVDEG